MSGDDVDLPKLRGIEAEVLLRTTLAKIGKSAGGLWYVSPTSFYLPTENGVTEIDAVFIHESGVYVFECKHMTGAVSGKLRDRMWTKTGDGRVLSFQNPVLQNRRHADSAAAYFSVNRTQCVSCIVFNDACDISRVETGNELIVKTEQVGDALLPRMQRRVFAEDELRAIIQRAEKITAAASKYTKAHAAGIREAKQRKKAEKKRGR